MTKNKQGRGTASENISTFSEKVAKIDITVKVVPSFKIAREDEGIENDVSQTQEMVSGKWENTYQD